jgi:signal transduction histidine kinase
MLTVPPPGSAAMRHHADGHGVQGMSGRLSALGGTLEITSAPGPGTRVTGRVPALATGRAG